MFIGYWLYAIFYSHALYRNLGIKLEPWIIAAGLFLQIGNYKNYMGRETIENSANQSTSHCLTLKEQGATLPSVLHSILQGNGSASGQCSELGCDRAGHRCPVSSLSSPGLVFFWKFFGVVFFGFFFLPPPEWLKIPRDCNVCRDVGFFFRVSILCMLFHVCMEL